MGDTGFVELVVRSIVSLGLVLLLIGGAYVIAKRRGGISRPSRASRGGRGGAMGGAMGGVMGGARARQQSKREPAALETLGRVGLSRGAVAMAVRFGDNVVLLGLTEGAPITVLQDMPATRWDELTEVESVVTSAVPTDILGNEIPANQRPTFVEALREATVRRA